jgi:23S rRNA pseudouridine955/2504/2580 synthase
MVLTQDQTVPRLVEIDDEEAGQRIDNFLTRHLKGVPKSHIYRILRRGEVRVNGGRIRPQYKLCAGDQVRIPPLRLETPPGRRTLPDDMRKLPAAILYEDRDILIIDKPAGMAVHGGSGVSHGVIEALRINRPDLHYVELAHRLDRDTSGCLILAKRRSTLRTLHGLFRSGAVEKRYLALVRGRWRGGPRVVEAPLRKNLLQGGERMVRIDATGKAARTTFRPLTLYRDASLMEIDLETGRTHQIRVHAAHIGCPLAGDEKYGDVAFNRAMRKAGLHRLFLHAHQIAFADSANNRDLHVSAPLGEELGALLDRLETQGQQSRAGRR